MIQLDYNNHVQNIQINLPLYEQIVTNPIMKKTIILNSVFLWYQETAYGKFNEKNNIKFIDSWVTRKLIMGFEQIKKTN